MWGEGKVGGEMKTGMCKCDKKKLIYNEFLGCLFVFFKSESDYHYGKQTDLR